MNIRWPARILISVIVLSGCVTLAYATRTWSSAEYLRFVSLLVLTVCASRLKLSLPGVTGNMSMNLPFILISTAVLGFSQAVVIAFVATLVQSLPQGLRKIRSVQTMFNVSVVVVSVAVAELILAMHGRRLSTMLLVAGAAYLLTNTVPVAAIIALTERLSALKTWYNIFRLSFPYYVLGATIAVAVLGIAQLTSWFVPLSVLPVMFFIYRSYKLYFSGLASQSAALQHVRAKAMGAAAH